MKMNLRLSYHFLFSTTYPLSAKKPGKRAADLLVSGPLSNASENEPIALIPLGNLPIDQVKAFSHELKRALNGRELIVSDNLLQTSRCSTQLVLTSLGSSTRTEISQFCQKLALQGTPMAGWIFLEG